MGLLATGHFSASGAARLAAGIWRSGRWAVDVLGWQVMPAETGWKVADMLARTIEAFERGDRVDFEAVLREYRDRREAWIEDEEISR